MAKIAMEHRIHTPYIVGGIPRDMLLGKLLSVNDIDITTGYSDVHNLADLFAKHMGVEPKIFKDGHKKVSVDKYTFDFSSNFIYPNIQELLADQKLKSSDGLVKETYSRDFTINTLLVPLDFSQIIDLTKVGADDCRNRVLRCPVDSEEAIKASPNRIVRAIYYMAKYDLNISGELKDAIVNNVNLLGSISPKYSTDKISKAIEMRPDMLDFIISLGVLKKIPLTTSISDLLIKNKKLLEVVK